MADGPKPLPGDHRPEIVKRKDPSYRARHAPKGKFRLLGRRGSFDEWVVDDFESGEEAIRIAKQELDDARLRMEVYDENGNCLYRASL